MQFLYLFLLLTKVSSELYKGYCFSNIDMKIIFFTVSELISTTDKQACPCDLIKTNIRG